MTADRAYRPAMTPEAAQAELRRCAGGQFDPAVVNAFLGVLRRDGRGVGTLGLAPAGGPPPERVSPVHART
jgi:HD-GYP domain-containing protein (c-di-GMP phosphodiesterase class II)